MAEANLRWKAQTSEAEAQILALKAVIDSIGGGSTSSRIRGTSSELDKLGKDGEKAGGLIRREFDKIPSSLAKFGAGLSGPFGILKPLGLVIQAGGLLGKGLQDLGKWMGQLGSEGEQAASGLLGMVSSMGPLVAAGGPLVAIFVALGGALLVLPALAAVAAAALVALLDVITTLSAIVAGFVAPLTLVVGLLGGLGAAFAYVTKQSLANKSSMQDQHDALLKLHIAQQTYNADLQKYGANATQTESALVALHKAQDAYKQSQIGVAIGSAHLDDKFHALIKTLTRDFTPDILKLVGAASQALSYLDRIAKLPLDKAFKSISTQGVHLLNEFVHGVGNAISEPIRLAIKVAFSPSSHMHDAVQSWWDGIRRFLFGYTKDHPPINAANVRTGLAKAFDPAQNHVAGALQPLIRWFDRQDFTQTGHDWAKSIVTAITQKGGFWDTIKPFVETVAQDAGHAAGQAFATAFEAELVSIPGAIFNAIANGSVTIGPGGGGTGGAQSGRGNPFSNVPQGAGP